MLWFFMTIAAVTWLPAALLMRVTQGRRRRAHAGPTQRGRASAPVNADCAGGRLALM